MRFELAGEEGALGGCGSGWHRPRKLTVEESICLNMRSLLKQKHVVSERDLEGTLEWRRRSGHLDFALGYMSRVGSTEGTLELIYPNGDQLLESCVKLVATRPNYGGKQWWFICPGLQKRVRHLYLPPNDFEFLSREAHGLSYHSSQTSGRWRALARSMGMTESQLNKSNRS